MVGSSSHSGWTFHILINFFKKHESPYLSNYLNTWQSLHCDSDSPSAQTLWYKHPDCLRNSDPPSMRQQPFPHILVQGHWHSWNCILIMPSQKIYREPFTSQRYHDFCSRKHVCAMAWGLLELQKDFKPTLQFTSSHNFILTFIQGCNDYDSTTPAWSAKPRLASSHITCGSSCIQIPQGFRFCYICHSYPPPKVSFSLLP